MCYEDNLLHYYFYLSISLQEPPCEVELESWEGGTVDLGP